jgi:hypothetical protein
MLKKRISEMARARRMSEMMVPDGALFPKWGIWVSITVRYDQVHRESGGFLHQDETWTFSR